MTHQPRVSVVTTTYNRAVLLAESIESVVAQTLRDWELIVVDDGSTDQTRQVVARLAQDEPRIRYVYQANRGVSHARASGSRLARGAYLAFLDDDDLFLPSKLACQAAFLDAHPKVALVYSYVDWIRLSTGAYLQTSPSKSCPPVYSFLELVRGNVMAAHSVLVRARCVEAVGGFRDTRLGCDDYDMWLRISRRYPMAFLPELVGFYRWHDTNMTYDRQLRYRDLLGIYEDLLKAGLSADEQRQVRARCASLSHARAVEAVDAEDYAHAASAYRTALFYDPLIGLRVPWGRYPHGWYRVLRPYLGAAYYGSRALGGGANRLRGMTRASA